MIRTWWKVVAVGLLSGVVGVGLVWTAQHLWQDHLALHELATIELQRQQQQQAQPSGK